MIIAKYNNLSAPVAVDLFEAQAELGTVGAGISVWPRTRALLTRLGLMDQFDGELGVEDGVKSVPGVLLDTYETTFPY